MRQNKKNNGFTLVELLIVVAIIGILAAVLTPQFLNARKVAADRAAEAYAHNVYTAVQAHIASTGKTDDITGNVRNCTEGWNGLNTDYPVPSPSGGNITLCDIAEEGTGVYVEWSGGTMEPDQGVTAGDHGGSVDVHTEGATTP